MKRCAGSQKVKRKKTHVCIFTVVECMPETKGVSKVAECAPSTIRTVNNASDACMQTTSSQSLSEPTKHHHEKRLERERGVAVPRPRSLRSPSSPDNEQKAQLLSLKDKREGSEDPAWHDA